MFKIYKNLIIRLIVISIKEKILYHKTSMLQATEREKAWLDKKNRDNCERFHKEKERQIMYSKDLYKNAWLRHEEAFEILNMIEKIK